jgi:hypothetical protein
MKQNEVFLITRHFYFHVQIVNLFEGCRSGLTMLAVIDFLLTTSIQHTEGFVVPWESKVRLECDNKFQRVSNCNIAIDLAQKQPFSCNLVGIAGMSSSLGSLFHS